MFRLINQFSGRSIILDKIMIFISNKIRYVYFLILIIMWFKGSIYKKMAVHAGISVLISLMIHFLIKLIYFKPRPFLKRRVGILIPSKMDSSFPSKHTLLTFAVSTTIYFYQRFLGTVMGGLSFLTGVSRIWVGHHYPVDILGSAILGSTISMFVQKLSHRSKRYLARKRN